MKTPHKLDYNDYIKDESDGKNHKLLVSRVTKGFSGLKSLKVEKVYNNTKSITETQILHDVDAIEKIVEDTHQDCKISLDLYCDANGPSLMIDYPLYRQLYTHLKKNKVRIRIIVEITKDNIKYCKKIIELFDAHVNHLEGIKGNFAILDNELYLATAIIVRDKPLHELIYSNVKDIVQQNKYLFDTLWKISVPASQKINEIENGILPTPTNVLDNPVDVLNYTANLIKDVQTRLSVCTSISYFETLQENELLRKEFQNLLCKNEDSKTKTELRWITNIEDNQNSVNQLKKYLQLGIKIRHTRCLPSLDFVVSDSQFMSNVGNIARTGTFKNLLHSSELLYVQHFQMNFDELWNNSIEAEERIRQIEKGMGSEITKIIDNADQTKAQLIRMIKDAKNEISVVFPTVTSFNRQENMGIFDLLIDKSHRGIKIKILSPVDYFTKEIRLVKDESSPDKTNNILIKGISSQHNINSTIAIVDSENVLTVELKDDSAPTFEDAIGTSTFSTSIPTVMSFVSIFDTLWAQAEMFENLRINNAKLAETEQTERDFINAAAHELRTPTQAITGYAELDDIIFEQYLDKKKSKDVSLEDLQSLLDNLRLHHDTISKNATRLDNLINNLLDVAKIDSSQKNLIMLDYETFDLTEEIKEIINNQLVQKLKNKNVAINFINDDLAEIHWIMADRSRLNQILANLLDNAIKFSKNDTSIDILIYESANDLKNEKYLRGFKSPQGKVKSSSMVKQGSEIYVAISDSGKSISPNILPRLFEKFNTDSGTGLGLYISKKLVDAMGGRIWAFNNSDGVGSTFIFSLPNTEQK